MLFVLFLLSDLVIKKNVMNELEIYCYLNKVRFLDLLKYYCFICFLIFVGI